MIRIRLLGLAVALGFWSITFDAGAYTHPSIPFAADDWAAVKANLDKQP
jgi:hypothetical protein